MDIIQEGKQEVHKMASLNCCWPPGTMNSEAPAEQ